MGWESGGRHRMAPRQPDVRREDSLMGRRQAVKGGGGEDKAGSRAGESCPPFPPKRPSLPPAKPWRPVSKEAPSKHSDEDVSAAQKLSIMYRKQTEAPTSVGGLSRGAVPDCRHQRKLILSAQLDIHIQPREGTAIPMVLRPWGPSSGGLSGLGALPHTYWFCLFVFETSSHFAA